MAEAKRDGNYVPTLTGVSSADGSTPVNVYVDPTTHRLLVSSVPGSLDDLTDVTITSAAQGDILYYNGTAWVNLAAGTNGNYLKTQGAGANPVWAAVTASPGGSDTQVQFNDGGTLSGDAGFVFNKTTDIATIGGVVTPSTGSGYYVYNTVDQTTNYERTRLFYNSNVFTILQESGGTGVTRTIRIGSATQFINIEPQAVSPKITVQFGSTGVAVGSNISGTHTSASIVQASLSLTPTISQSSTGGYTALLINPTESSTGSGAKNLIQAQVGGSDKFTVDNTGAVVGTKFNGLTITSSTGTLTITNGKTLSFSNTLTFTGTDGSSVAFGAGGTVAYTANKLSVFAATTSSELAGVISDETGSGALVFATSPTLTTPRFADLGYIADANGNELIVMDTVASAIPYIRVANAATGGNPLIIAEGETNVTLQLAGTGTGKVYHSTSIYGDITSDSDGATVTFNLATSNIHTVTLGGNRTLALSNAAVGQCFIVRLVQDGTGSRTVTWFTTIKWAGGVAPTLTTTASKADTFGFLCTSSGNYDGYVIGQNI